MILIYENRKSMFQIVKNASIILFQHFLYDLNTFCNVVCMLTIKSIGTDLLIKFIFYF